MLAFSAPETASVKELSADWSATTPFAVRRRHCRLCGEGLNEVLVELGMSPPCEAFLKVDQLDDMEPHYPLQVWVCEECFLVQVRNYVDPEHIFRDYAYFSSFSTSWVEHARAYCSSMQAKLDLNRDSLVVEVGSNDGYLLKHFVAEGVPVLGIEPAANVAAAAVEQGVRTQVAFFGERLARELVDSGLQADLIVGNNVLAQVPDLNDFIAGLSRLLKPNGVISLEFPHLQKLLEEFQFDTIYHEHYSYFSLWTVNLACGRHGLRVVDVEELATHGGSLRVFLAPVGSARIPTAAVEDLLARERASGLCDLAVYRSFAEGVRRVKRDLLSFLIAAKNEGKKICGYGAPGKGNTLLNYCGVGVDFLDFTVDRNPYKHGRFTPGMHIPIHPVAALYEARPDYILILPWNLRAEIMEQLADTRAWGAKFVIPIPELAILD